MEGIEKLSLNESLGEDNIKSTDWADVRDYKFIRIVCFMDCKSTLQVNWSHDGKTSCIVQNNPQSALTWKSYKLPIEMDYCRFTIITNYDSRNDILTLITSGRKYSNAVDERKIERSIIVRSPSIEDVKENEVIEKRNPSPFRKHLFQKKERRSSLTPETKDKRLPDLILSNQVFISKDKRIVALPGGISGDVLGIDKNGFINWVSPSDVDDIHDK
jgi:hypothetical protein